MSCHIVHEWTYTFSGEKVDEKNQPLAGAGFTLKKDGTAVQLVSVATPGSKANVTAAADTQYFRVATAEEIADTSTTKVTEILTTAAQNKFMILGLDDAKAYTLEETTVPDTYNKCADISATMTANFVDTAETPSAKSGTGEELFELAAAVTGGGTASANSVTIENSKGSTLPATGGIGTKLFVVGGGLTAALAGVYLISKKRSKEEDAQ